MTAAVDINVHSDNGWKNCTGVDVLCVCGKTGGVGQNCVRAQAKK